jgi:iron-sulfur cluster assembly protein
MDYVQADQIKKFDEVVEDSGVKVIIDSKAIMALVGTEMNFVEDELGSQFVFNNPNEKGRCGCGTSFHL